MARPAQLRPNPVTEADEIATCMQLKREGLTVRDIADRTGLSPSTVQRRITAGVEMTVSSSVAELRVSETARLAKLSAALEPKVKKGDVPAVAEARRIGESLRKLHGADAPVVQEIHLDARIDTEAEATVGALMAAVSAVVELLDLDAGWSADVEKFALGVAVHALDPTAGPPPEPPKRKLALMPGSGPADGPAAGPRPVPPRHAPRTAEDDVQDALDAFEAEFGSVDDV